MKRLIAGVFSNEKSLLGATRAVRLQGLRIVDAFTPYAVHGLDEAMGMAPSRLGRICFGFGVLGVILAFGMQYWTSAFDWPINVGGRPWNSWPAFVPVAFEVMVLLASFGVVLAFFAVARLFPGRRPALVAPEVTNDQFVLVLEETDAAFEPQKLQVLFERCDAVATIENWGAATAGDATPAASSRGKRWNIALAFALAAVVVLNLIVGVNVSRRNVEFLPDMVHPPSFPSFAANPNFPNGSTQQNPVDGTVARGQLPWHFGPSPEEAIRAGKEVRNPVAEDDKRAKQLGPVLYGRHCQVCHGAEGKGDGPVTLRGVPPPPSLLAEKAVAMPDGQMFHVLTHGQLNMASYANHLTVEERWFVILHVRAMQKQAGGK